MATTISRPAMTDDSGTPASPTGDGTTLNKSFFDTILDNIDAMWSGATQVFDGTFLAQGFGLHQINASGTGGQRLNIRNQSAGTGNFAQLALNNDLNRGMVAECFASTWTTAAHQVQDGANVAAAGPGGLSLAATEATADVRIYANGNTKKSTFDGDAHLLESGVAGSYALSGTLRDSINTTAAGTPANTNKTTLHSYSLPAGALAVDGQSIRITAAFKFAANSNAKRVGIDFGGTTIYGGTSDFNYSGGTPTITGSVRLVAEVIRTGASQQKSIASANRRPADDSNHQSVQSGWFAEPTETLSGAITIAIFGVNGTASANDIECEFSMVELLP